MSERSIIPCYRNGAETFIRKTMIMSTVQEYPHRKMVRTPHIRCHTTARSLRYEVFHMMWQKMVENEAL
jgi:hypothetical protein